MTNLLVWQLVDSAFPTGGFSHSWGFESAWQHGEIPDRQAFCRFVAGTIRQAGHGALPFLNVVYDTPARLEECDRLAEAFITNPVANRASRAQGRTLVASASRIWDSAHIADLDRRVRPLACHMAPVSGAVFKLLDVPLAEAQRMLLFTTVRGVLSAAVRLGAVGSYEGQRIQASLATDIDETARDCGRLGLDDLAQTSPLIDLFHGAHDRLYSRLFQS